VAAIEWHVWKQPYTMNIVSDEEITYCIFIPLVLWLGLERIKRSPTQYGTCLFINKYNFLIISRMNSCFTHYKVPAELSAKKEFVAVLKHGLLSKWLTAKKWITNSMGQSASWEANRSSATQEILRILWNPKVHYRIQSARHLSLSWASSSHVPNRMYFFDS
jgi:hypothetical protein